MKRLLIAAAIALCACPAVAATPATTLVVLPLENASTAETAPRQAAALIEAAVAKRGWTIAPHDQVEQFLEENRVRYLDSLDSATREKLLAATGASAVLVGTLYTWRDGDEPIVAMSARLLRIDGRFAWGDAAGISATDTEGLLGLGRKKTAAAIAPLVVSRLLRRFPAPGDSGAIVRGKSKPIFRGSPETFRSAALERGAHHRVCILPFDSASPERHASRVVGDLLAIRLAAAGSFDIVEPADFRAAMRAEKVQSIRAATSAELVAIGKRIGTTMFLRGTIDEFREAAPSGNVTPDLQMYVLLVDAAAGKILWTADHARNGSDYQGLLLLGSITNAVTLADRVVSEMVAAEEHARLRGSAPITSKGLTAP